MPEIDREKCDLCGLCVEACKGGAIVIKSGVIIVIETEACGWCTVCEAVCPTGALTCAFDISIEG
jgi:MinD superfamily P-loop ATPase